MGPSFQAEMFLRLLLLTLITFDLFFRGIMLLQEIYISRVYCYWQDVITLIRLPYIFVILIGALCKTGHIARFMLFNLKVYLSHCSLF